MAYSPNLVVTVIAESLQDARVNDVVDVIQHQGAAVTSVEWLGQGEACDIAVYYPDEFEFTQMMSAYDAGVDAVVQPVGNRRKKLLISDMDSTIIQQECIDELADCMGLKDKISAITERAMNGELEFQAALRERVALLKGLPEGELERVFAERITLTPGARTLVQTMKKLGARTVLVSGGFTFFTERVAKAAGFEEQEANTLLIENGVLTGKVAEPILDKHSKLEALYRYCDLENISKEDALAVGDGANDLPMLLEAGMGVAYHAKPTVRSQTRAKIQHTTLTSLLYLQGIAKKEWVE